VRYLIARKPTFTEYARPLAMRQLLDECTFAEYAFHEYWVARVEPVCRAAAASPLEPAVAVRPGNYDDFDPAILLRGDWERSDKYQEAYGHTVTFTNISGAEIRFAFRGSELTYGFTRAPNRGIAAITIDGISYGSFDLYAAEVQWRSSLPFANLGPGRHLVVIRVTGEKRATATGTFVDLDSFRVR